MKRFVFVAVLFLTVGFPRAGAQHVPVLTFSQFEPLLHQANDTLYLVNFWATWCGPCVRELPDIERVAGEMAGRKFSVILVSLDAVASLDDRVIPFINKNNIRSRVVLLNDPDFNRWIDKVDTGWSGAIPASLFYRGKVRHFYEQTFTYEELNRLIKNKIKMP